MNCSADSTLANPRRPYALTPSRLSSALEVHLQDEKAGRQKKVMCPRSLFHPDVSSRLNDPLRFSVPIETRVFGLQQSDFPDFMRVPRLQRLNEEALECAPSMY